MPFDLVRLRCHATSARDHPSHWLRSSSHLTAGDSLSSTSSQQTPPFSFSLISWLFISCLSFAVRLYRYCCLLLSLSISLPPPSPHPRVCYPSPLLLAGSAFSLELPVDGLVLEVQACSRRSGSPLISLQVGRFPRNNTVGNFYFSGLCMLRDLSVVVRLIITSSFHFFSCQINHLSIWRYVFRCNLLYWN